MAQRIHAGHSHDHGHDYGTANFYGGGDSVFDPEFSNYSFSYGTGYNIQGHMLGTNPANPTSSDQLSEAINAIKQGAKAFEIQLLGLGQNDPDQGMPIQHFKELRALMELTGVKPSVHGPLVDPAGFGQQGWGGEEHRIQNERRMFNAVEKAYITDPNNNIPVVFHTGNASGYVKSYRPDKESKDGKKEETVPMIDLESNRVVPVKESRMYSIGGNERDFETGRLKNPFKIIKEQNKNDWDNRIREATLAKNTTDEILRDTLGNASGLGITDMEIKNEEDAVKFSKTIESNPYLREGLSKISILEENNDHAINNLFHRAYKYGSPEQKEKLKEISNQFKEDIGKVRSANQFRAQINRAQIQGVYIDKIREATEDKAPEVYQVADDFAMKEAAKSFGNVAAQSYIKYGKKAPLIAIENTYEGLGWADANSHRKLIEESRKVFIDKVMKEKKIGESAAKKMADKLIGATWDVSHINIAKSKGFDDKYVVEQTKTIAPMVKHVHLADNFGFSDSHLAPGMGNTPIKKILEELEKEGKIDEMRMIVEAGGFGGPFKKPLHPASLNAFGGSFKGYDGGAGWDSAFVPGAYFGGYGTTNPEIHHSFYGAGFTTLPIELGGNMPGGQSRFGGTPMA